MNTLSCELACEEGNHCGYPDCKICHERQRIQSELDSGITPERICVECYNVFELDKNNPFGDILFCEGVGVYFNCDKCFILEGDEDADEAEHLDDTDGDSASWLCATCGDPAYDCECADDEILDLDDEIDRMAERFPDGEDPMLKHVINAQCTKCEIGFDIYAGQVAWCPECHIHKDPARPPVEILEDVEAVTDEKSRPGD